MRLFYDVSSSRLRAELALLAADAGAVTTVVLFAAGAAFSGAELPDLALLVVWSAMPVAIARVLRGVEIPREPWRRMLPSAILGLSLAGLIVLALYVVLSLRFIPQVFGLPMGRAIALMAFAVLIPHLVGFYFIGQRTGIIR